MTLMRPAVCLDCTPALGYRTRTLQAETDRYLPILISVEHRSSKTENGRREAHHPDVGEQPP